MATIRATAREPRQSEAESASKEQAILAAAWRVFLDRGYGAASMDAIAEDAGVSKQTVYSHFGGKDALFGAIVKDKCDQLVGAIPIESTSGVAPEVTLSALARRFLALVLENTEFFRVVVAECGRFPELAEAFYRSGPWQAANNLAKYLAEIDGKGLLTVPNPESSARLFFAMLRGDLWLRRLLGLESQAAAGDVDDVVGTAVAAFLAAHRPRRSPPR